MTTTHATPSTPDRSSDWAAGVSFDAFLPTAAKNTDLWSRTGRVPTPPDVLARVAAVPGAWRLLVLSEDWCGDAANTVPVLARLADEAPSLELRLLARTLPALDDLLAVPRQRLDACAGRLPRALRANAQIHHTQLTRAASRLSPRLLAHRIERCREQTAAFGDRARRAFRIFRERREQRLRSAGQLLTAYSYRGVLARGFALVRDGDGRPLRAATAVGSGMRLNIEFSDGRIGATADGEQAAQPPAKPRPRARGGEGSGGQGNLFGA